MAAQTGVVGERRWMWPAFAAPGLLWLIVLFLTPFYAILAVAMGKLDPIFNIAEPVWNPLDWDTTAFIAALRDLFGGQLGQTFLRTIVFVAVASALSLLIGYPVAYYVARRAGRWKVLLLVLLIAPFWINYLMRMISWINLLGPDGYVNRALVALGVLQEPRVWIGQPETVILGLVYGYLPWLILPLYAALDRIDGSVLEAARDLGANAFQTFVRVTLPLSKQAILAGLVIITLPMFGDYYTPDLLGQNARTRMIGNDIDLFIHAPVGGAKGAAVTIFLMLFVATLMIYYLVSVARATREAR